MDKGSDKTKGHGTFEDHGMLVDTELNAVTGGATPKLYFPESMLDAVSGGAGSCAIRLEANLADIPIASLSSRGR